MFLHKRNWRGYADETKVVRVIEYDPLRNVWIKYIDDQVKPLFSESLCKLCGRKEQVFPCQTLHVCDLCLKRCGAVYDKEDVMEGRVIRLIGMICDLCNERRLEGVKILNARLCWHCLWYRLAKNRHRFSVGGTRIV